MFQKAIKLSKNAIESSNTLEKLKKLSEEYRKLLGIEFPSQEKEIDLNNNFSNPLFKDYNKFNFNLNGDRYHCSRKDKIKR